MSVVLVEATRGPLAETLHRGDVAVVDAAGRLLYRAGHPREKVTFWRSSAKPFQAMPLVYTGAAERWGLDAADLALCCASHSGEPAHTDRALAILARIGLGEEWLRCGAHPPHDPETAEALRREGRGPTPRHSNCSGKHAGMLALARHMGWPCEGYLEPDHPVQRVILENVCAVTGLAAGDIPLGVDGCGVPTFGLSVYHMALAFARLVDPDAIPEAPGQGVELPAGVAPPAPAERRRAAAAVCRAMMDHPYLVAGRNRADTDLMQAVPGRVVCKGGASGVWCLAIPPAVARQVPALAGAQGGVGVALKIEDGGALGSREVAGLAALAQLGVLGPADLERLAAWARPPVKNVAGRVVGEVRSAFRLEPA